MKDLLDFIRARLDEDEAAARESHYEGQRWLTEEEGVHRWPEDELVHMADRKADARHIARHDPARVLREVEAKWHIVRDYERAARACSDATGSELDSRGYASMCGARDALRAACAALAAAWSDHPDYRKEWAP